MKPNYKNWVPKGMLVGMFAGTAVLAVLWAAAAFTSVLSGTPKLAAEIILGVLCLGLLVFSLLYLNLYNSFSYDGRKQISRRIIGRISEYVKLPDGGVGLDVGCGSGALTIACAKRNPRAAMVGLDRWGKEYASFNRKLCEDNAKIEGVSGNTSFTQGDACKLDFPDGHFDAVTSNYCYHNIPSRDRQALILETLRVLKKGGTFAIHDEFTKSKYGDTDKLVKKLRDMGYERVELVDTTNGLFLTHKEAAPLFLVGSGLLVGRK